MACAAIILVVTVVVLGGAEERVAVTIDPTAIAPVSAEPSETAAALATAVSNDQAAVPQAESKPFAAGTPSFAGIQEASPTELPEPSPTPLPTLAVNPPSSIDQRPIPARAANDLDAFFNASYPPHNYFEAVSRLTELELGSRTITGPFYQVGDEATFFVQEGTVQAILMAATDHAYFWVEVGLPIPQAEVLQAAERFEEAFYPLVVYLFGSPWLPGVDNDPRFTVLHVNDVNNSDELGYFTDLDEYPRTLYQTSNEQEIIYLNMSQLTINSDLYFGTLVHELQHLIHWHRDANEATWLNEGLAQLAELYVGLNTVSVEPYLTQTAVSLNRWTYDEPEVDAHYANAYLFSTYVWEQLGETAVQQLVEHQGNGIASLRAILPDYTNRSWQQFLADWSVATYLDDIEAGLAYNYRELALERPSATTTLAQSNYEAIKELVPLGVHYIDLDYEGLTTVTFVGDTVVDLLDSPPLRGEAVWFAPDMNEVDSQLTAVFDLRGLTQATLNFDAWYDLEPDWDFAYLSVSTDGGTTWELVETLHSVEGTYGPGFNGRSADAPDAEEGWISETVLLDAYVDQVVHIRFELLTDSTGPSRGFALDNIAVPELGYETFVDDEQGEWQAVGFVKTGWQLPQLWQVKIIEHGPTPTIVSLPLNHFNQGQWSVNLGPEGGTLVVMPQTPFVEASATYWLKLE
ncbi:MAG: hypothetical protein AAF614_34185 [Chloroflexota bacterium]